jgi:hypothetical protein
MRGDKSGRKDGTFERADFTYDDKNDLYVCPGGKELRQKGVGLSISECILPVPLFYVAEIICPVVQYFPAFIFIVR